jgi:lipid-A-disaccharide synthase
MLIKVPYISLVNLICGKEVVAELIQQDFNENNLAKHLQQLLDETHRSAMLQSYSELKSILGGNGASEKAAQLMWQYLNK